MPRILVTGASGFIGGKATELFQSRGWDVIGTGRRPLPWPRYFQCDLSSEYQTMSLAKLGRFDVILHAAARSSPWGSKRSFCKSNVDATQNVMRLAEVVGLPKLIFVSSSSTYYESRDQFEIDEETPQSSHPVNHYAATKQAAEKLIQNYRGSWCILRPRAVYGVGDSVLFPRILAAAKAGRMPLLTRKGPPVVGDLLCIDNLLCCFAKAAQDDSVHGTFNLTDNQPVPIIEFLLDVFQRLEIPSPNMKLSVQSAFRAARVIELIYKCFYPWKEPPITPFGVHVFAYSKTFNVSKMLDVFGPPMKTVEQGVTDFVNWVKEVDPYMLKS
jgi:nucleoside-diphosphate-sugar epimerase